MATPLPEKVCITGDSIDFENLLAGAIATFKPGPTATVSPDDLTPEARAKYDAYYAEKARRKDPSQVGVAQEALDLLDECLSSGCSTAKLHSYGYSMRSTVMPAVAEEQRIIKELAEKPSADIEESTEVALKVADVKAKYSIAEYKEVGDVGKIEPKIP